ncbi:MAG TPA: hypothetical protein PLC99_24395 [Verrucomicrobiota bacterium]|nr:hypothetical protein [Verrucomicrobiota bacterium]
MSKSKRRNPALDALFDIYEQQRAIEVIRDWASLPDNRYTESDADTIKELLVDPLWEWIEQQGDNTTRRADVAAAIELVECADSDIVYGFRYRQKVHPCHIDELDRLWREFQRIVGADMITGVLIQQEVASSRQSKNASKPRKKEVTKASLDKFRDTFEAEYGRSWGWKKAACIEFEIDLKTLNSRLIEGVATATHGLL